MNQDERRGLLCGFVIAGMMIAEERLGESAVGNEAVLQNRFEAAHEMLQHYEQDISSLDGMLVSCGAMLQLWGYDKDDDEGD